MTAVAGLALIEVGAAIIDQDHRARNAKSGRGSAPAAFGRRAVFRAEDKALSTIRERVATGTTVYADEAPGWDALPARFDMRRINHTIAFSDEGACTNQAESYFSHLRRAEGGQHHHISGKCLGAYAREIASREDTRRRPNGRLHALAAGAALGHPVSRMWKGY